MKVRRARAAVAAVLLAAWVTTVVGPSPVSAESAPVDVEMTDPGTVVVRAPALAETQIEYFVPTSFSPYDLLNNPPSVRVGSSSPLVPGAGCRVGSGVTQLYIIECSVLEHYFASDGDPPQVQVEMGGVGYLAVDETLHGAIVGSDDSDIIQIRRVLSTAYAQASIFVDAGSGFSVDGAAGNDVILSGAGDDSLQGGPGTDTVSYDRLPPQHPSWKGCSPGSGVIATIDGLANDGCDGETDNLGTDVEVLIGSDADDRLGAHPSAGSQLEGGSGNDLLVGGSGPDQLFGGAGDDVLRGGGGADVMGGGDGLDLVTYSERTTSVEVSLDDVANDGSPGLTLIGGGTSTGRAERDNVLSSVEWVIGGSGADVLTGNDLFNRLDGGSGGDVVRALGGHDALVGGRGADTLDGGDGRDSCLTGEVLLACEVTSTT